MSIDPKILDAKNQVEVKRAQLLHSIKFALGETKRRLAPDLIAEMAWEETKRATGKIADNSVDFAKRKPWLVGGLAAAAGLFLARKPIGKLAVSGYQSVTGHDDEQAEGPARAAKQPPRRTRTSETPSPERFHEATKPIEEKKKRPSSKASKTKKMKEEEVK